MLPQAEVSKKVPLSLAKRQRVIQKVFSDFAKQNGVPARRRIERSKVLGPSGRETW